MNATTLIAIQFISLIIMIGTAEELFTTIYPAFCRLIHSFCIMQHIHQQQQEMAFERE